MGERLVHRDFCQHKDAAALGRHHQFACSCLPMRLCLISFRYHGDVVAGIAKGSKGAAVGELDWIIEGARPGHQLALSRAMENCPLGVMRNCPLQPAPKLVPC